MRGRRLISHDWKKVVFSGPSNRRDGSKLWRLRRGRMAFLGGFAYDCRPRRTLMSWTLSRLTSKSCKRCDESRTSEKS